MKKSLVIVLLISTMFLYGCTSCDDVCEKNRLEIMRQQEEVQQARRVREQIEQRELEAQPGYFEKKNAEAMESVARSQKYLSDRQKVVDTAVGVGIGLTILNALMSD